MPIVRRAISLGKANDYINTHHRHHKQVQGHKFSIAAYDGDRLVGVVIIGRPVARGLDDGTTVEVTRLCTDGTANACSFLYGAAAQAAKAIGYESIVTYILASESGVTLKASGWSPEATVEGRSWSCPSRPRTDKHPTVDKTRWRRRFYKLSSAVID